MGDSTAYKTLFACTMAMIVLPLASFFTTRKAFEHFANTDGNIAGAVTAVITANLIVFIFVYKAYEEDKVVKPADKTD